MRKRKEHNWFMFHFLFALWPLPPVSKLKGKKKKKNVSGFIRLVISPLRQEWNIVFFLFTFNSLIPLKYFAVVSRVRWFGFLYKGDCHFWHQVVYNITGVSTAFSLILPSSAAKELYMVGKEAGKLSNCDNLTCDNQIFWSAHLWHQY